MAVREKSWPSAVRSPGTEKVEKRRANSPRFHRFVGEYRRTGDAYQSALAAGYTPAMAKGRSYELARLARQVFALAEIPPSGRTLGPATSRRCAASAVLATHRLKDWKQQEARNRTWLTKLWSE